MRAPVRTFVRARRLRREMTLPEVQLWSLLRRDALGGFHFRRQHPVGPYVLDFYSAKAKLAVEVDGAAHDVQSVVVRDTARDAWLRDQGIRVLRFPTIDVLKPSRRESVFDTIAAALTPEGRQ